MKQNPPSKIIQYALHGLILNVACDEAMVAEGVDSILDYFGMVRIREAASPAAISLTFLSHAAPLALPRSFNPPIRHNGIEIHRTQRCIYLRDGESVIQIRPSSNTARGVIQLSFSGGIARIETVNLIIHSILFLLRNWSFFALHAAGVVKDDRGLLLVGASNSGKSTQAMNLVRAGWKYLSDDSLLLRTCEGGVDAWALRRDFGLDESAESAYPEIRGQRRPFVTDERKQRIRMTSLYPDQSTEMCRPRVLLFPRIVDENVSRVSMIGESAALFRLMQQSVLLTAEPRTAAVHVAILKRLVQQTSRFELLAGRDLLNDPYLIDHMLKPIVSP